MADKPTPSSPEASSLEGAVGNVRDAADQASSVLNNAITVAAHGVVQAASAAQGIAASGMTQARSVADEAQVHMLAGISHYKFYEDQFFSALRHGIEWGVENPYVSYGAAGVGSVLLFPFARQLLWRSTLGRFRTAESVLRSAEGKVAALRPQVADFTKQSNKLQERMSNAEEEYSRGLQKLRATRQELQRLSTVVQRTERTAASTLAELRGLHKADSAVALRGEAAALLATLRSQRAQVDRAVKRIIAQDI